VEKPKKQTAEEPGSYNGLTVGAVMVLIGLAWFTFPYIFSGRFMVYPLILIGLGLITFVRHALKKRS
jgi:hypothetical protein